MIAVVWVPDFVLQAVLRQQNRSVDELAACVVTPPGRRDGGAPLQGVSEAARALHITPAMTLAQARSCCPELGVIERDPVAEAALRDSLRDLAVDFSPRIQCGQDEVALDTAGTERLFGPVETLARTLIHSAEKRGIYVRVGVARTRVLANWVARRCDAAKAWQLLPAASTAEQRFTAELPLASLPLSPDTLRTLQRFGLTSVGDFLALPAKRIAERLGVSAARLHRQLREKHDDGLDPEQAELVFEEKRRLEEPLGNLEPLAEILREMLDSLLERLVARGYAARQLGMTLRLVGAEPYATRIRMGAPTRERDVLLRLCRLRLADMPPAAPVEHVHLWGEPVPQRLQQLSLFMPSGPAPARLSVTQARIAALCGAERVGSPMPSHDYQQDTFSLEVLQPPKAASELSQQGDATTAAPVLGWALRRKRPPSIVEVVVANGRLQSVRANNWSRSVKKAWGPFRHAYNWWYSNRGQLEDIYDVQLQDDVRIRLRYCARSARWWLDGWYD